MVMPLGDLSWSLAQYLTFALWIAGSSYQVGEMEATPAPEPSLNMPATPLSIPSAVHLSSPSPSATLSNLPSVGKSPPPFAAKASQPPSVAPSSPPLSAANSSPPVAVPCALGLTGDL